MNPIWIVAANYALPIVLPAGTRYMVLTGMVYPRLGLLNPPAASSITDNRFDVRMHACVRACMDRKVSYTVWG